MLKLAEPHIFTITPYVAGHVGGEYKGSWAELASNENSLGPSPMALDAAKLSLFKAHLYPNNSRVEVIQKICRHLSEFNIKPSQIALGNGSSELIVNLVRGLLGPHEAMMSAWPTFIMYKQAAMSQNRPEIKVGVKNNLMIDTERMLEIAHNDKINPVKIVFLANPNNPTGKYINSDELDYFVSSLPKDIVLVIDEAYFEYVTKSDYPNGLKYLSVRPRTVVLRTFSKIYGMAGLRLGYAVGDEAVIDVLCRMRDPFNINVAVQYAAMAALDDHEHVQRTREHIAQYRPLLMKQLNAWGFQAHESVANFVLADCGPHMPSPEELAKRFMKKGVAIRPMASFGLPNSIRVSVGTNNELQQFFDGLKDMFVTRQSVLSLATQA